jgi:hypothetical protein
MKAVLFTTTLSVALAIASTSMAADIARQKIGEWGDPFTPPQSRTSCIGYASGDWPWGVGGKLVISGKRNGDTWRLQVTWSLPGRTI